MTDRPRVTSWLMKRWTAALEPMSMPLVGSSRMMTLGSVASHLQARHLGVETDEQLATLPSAQ
jgi:hypothetical protein